MKRLLSLALVFCLLSPLANAQTTLRIATLAPDGTSWMKIMREAAAQIQEETEGRVRIRYFPGGVQGSDKSVLRKIQIRQLHGGAVAAGALANITTMTQLYSLPFTFQSVDEVRAVRAQFDPVIKQALADKGFTLLGLSEGGFAYLMSAGSLENSKDFSSKKVWAPEGDIITQGTFKNAGVDPIALPVSDVYTSLQTGLLDTVAANPSSIIAMQWHSKMKYAADLPLAFLFGMLVVDSRALSKVSDADKKVISDRIAKAFKEMDAVNETDNISAREALINNGVTFQTLNDTEQAAWKKMASDSINSQMNKNIYPEQEFQQLLNYLESLRQQ